MLHLEEPAHTCDIAHAAAARPPLLQPKPVATDGPGNAVRYSAAQLDFLARKGANLPLEG